MKKVLVVVAFLLAAAACGGAANTADNPAPRQYGANGSGSAQGSQSNPQPGNIGGSTSSGTTLPADNVPVLQGPPVIRQAQLTITVGSGTFSSKLLEARTLVEAEGGYIAGTEAQAGPSVDNPVGQLRTGVLSFMVPAAHFDETIDELSKVGTLDGEHITGTDVSNQYYDLNARLDNAEAQHQVYLSLLAKATNVNDIIALQNQIGQITGQIEQLKGQIKYLDNNTTYSAITVTMTESGAPAQPASSDSWGFATALNQAAHNFVTTINYFVSGLGAFGPFVVLVVVGLLVWRSRRRAPRPQHAA